MFFVLFLTNTHITKIPMKNSLPKISFFALLTLLITSAFNHHALAQAGLVYTVAGGGTSTKLAKATYQINSCLSSTGQI